MRMRKIMAGLMACMIMGSTVATTAYAYSGEEDTTEPVVTVSETEEKEDTPSYWGTGTVNVDSTSHLHLRTGASTDYDIIGNLLAGAKVNIISEEDGWYKIVVPEQSGYVCGYYLDVVENPVEETKPAEPTEPAPTEPEEKDEPDAAENNGLTPDGNMTMVDDIGSVTGEGQQFITLVTKAGNTFYMVIDRDDDGNENVHFMNLVDEADLFALLDEDAQAAYKESQEQTEPEVPVQTEPVEEPEPTEQPEPEKKSGSWAPLMLLLIAAIAGGGGFLYISINKKKKEQAAAKPDPDADYKDEEDEEYEIPEEIEDEEEYEEAPSDDEE